MPTSTDGPRAAGRAGRWWPSLRPPTEAALLLPNQLLALAAKQAICLAIACVQNLYGGTRAGGTLWAEYLLVLSGYFVRVLVQINAIHCVISPSTQNNPEAKVTK
jgi:hypothetical protein